MAGPHPSSQSSPFRKQFLFTIGIGLGVVLGIISATVVIGIDIGKRTERINASRAKTAERTHAIDALVKLKEQSARAEQYTATLNTVLPHREELINFPNVAKALAGDHHVELNFLFGAETAAENGQPGSIEFQFVLKGTRENEIAFLEAFGRSSYIISFTSIEFEGAGTGFSAHVKGEIFFR